MCDAGLLVGMERNEYGQADLVAQCNGVGASDCGFHVSLPATVALDYLSELDLAHNAMPERP